jgi:hypothetical protein
MTRPTRLTQSRTRTPLSHPAEGWSTSYRKKTFRGRKTYIALDRSRGIECATDRVTEPGTAVGMQETYDEEMVRINVADRGLREVDQCE